MRINHRKSTELVNEYHLKGVQYATDSHWMIRRWLPEECIMGEMSISQFEAFCTARDIWKQKYGSCKSLLPCGSKLIHCRQKIVIPVFPTVLDRH